MIALILVPMVALWTADNHEFLQSVTDAPWAYVGYQARPADHPQDGSRRILLESEGHTFILFKQGAKPATADWVENAEAE